MWKSWHSLLSLYPIFCIRCSCMSQINYNSVKKKALARITDIHCTITETRARPRFYFMMQMFIRNESQLLGTGKLHCDVPALLSDCQMQRSQFNVFMTTVKSRQSHSVSISLRSDVDHRSSFPLRVTFKMFQFHPEMIYPVNEMTPNLDLLAQSSDNRMYRWTELEKTQDFLLQVWKRTKITSKAMLSLFFAISGKPYHPPGSIMSVSGVPEDRSVQMPQTWLTERTYKVNIACKMWRWKMNSLHVSVVF